MNTNVNEGQAAELTGDENDARSRLVRVTRIFDSSIFDGWGIKAQW